MFRSFAIVFLLLLCGCTHIKLQHKTLHQGSTLPKLQHQQVLDNLARFACDPNALAWHMKIAGGLVQVSDQGTASLLPGQIGAEVVPSVAAGRAILEQWNVDAVVESGDLELLQLAYQKAVNPVDPDRSIKRAVYEQVCELSAEYHLLLSGEVAAEMMEALKSGASGERLEKLQRIDARLADLYRRIDQILETDDPDRPVEGAATKLQVELSMARREVVKLTASVANDPFVPGYSVEKPQRGAAVVEQAEEKIKSLVALVTDRGDGPNPYSMNWLSCGSKHDVPKCACYVGHYKGCQGECYVWVEPEHASTFRDFTLLILSLVPPDAQEMALPKLGMGAAFSPAI
jgi:hypothetical protein